MDATISGLLLKSGSQVQGCRLGLAWVHETRPPEVPPDEVEGVKGGAEGTWLATHLA